MGCCSGIQQDQPRSLTPFLSFLTLVVVLPVSKGVVGRCCNTPAVIYPKEHLVVKKSRDFFPKSILMKSLLEPEVKIGHSSTAPEAAVPR